MLENLYGDIVSRPLRRPGRRPRRGAGREHRDDGAVFEAVHGSAPDIAGKGIANPMALMRSAVMMLYHMQKDEVAERVRRALHDVIVRQKIRTRDLGGEASTTQFTDAVVAAIETDAA